jgi:PleD family two-component response regulator
MLRSMLAKCGYDPVIARDGSEAWHALDSESSPRLAILEWGTPVMDGLDFCRRVRAAARELYTYLVLLRARSESQDLVEGMEAGADDNLTKPFVTHELRGERNPSRSCPGCCAEDARAHAERIRASFAGESFRARGEIPPVTCSFGLSWREVAASYDADALIREADVALTRLRPTAEIGWSVTRASLLKPKQTPCRM